MHHTRLATVFLVLLTLARIEGASLPSISWWQDQNKQRQTREIETEVAQLATQLRSGDQEERRDAAIKLSHIDGEAACSALASGLNDASPGLRALVLAGLGHRSETMVIPLVAARLTLDKHPFVRKAAAYALARFQGSARTAALIAGLKDKDPEVRGAVAVALANHADSSAVDPLATALSDKNDFVRAHSARALGVNGKSANSAVPALIKLLDSDSEAEVKRQAAAALGAIADRSALPSLERATRDSDSHLAQIARDSIRMIEGK